MIVRGSGHIYDRGTVRAPYIPMSNALLAKD